MLALGVFAVAHSALASRRAKGRADALLGERRSAGLYRFTFNALSVVKLIALFGYLHRLPDRTLYRVRGVPRLLMHAGQLLSLGMIVAAARQAGFGRISGVAPLGDLLAGDDVQPPPAAQHPAPRNSDELGWHGPYRLSSHPTNYFVLPAYWLSPVMTVKWAAIGLATTLYMVLGSIHEDARLHDVYGERFARYRAHVPHFLFPIPIGAWLRRQRT